MLPLYGLPTFSEPRPQDLRFGSSHLDSPCAGYLANMSARILIDSEHKPVLDQAAAELSIQGFLLE